MHGLLGKVIVQVLLVLKLEDKAVGKSLVKRFPRAVLACDPPVSQPSASDAFNTHRLSNS
jgi:hypothetical protein